MTTYTIRPATGGDLESMVELYERARQWLAASGTDQWSTNTPARIRTKIARSIAQGECYVADNDGTLIGMMTVDEFADPEFWNEEDNPPGAMYVHRMVVDRSASGKNVGGKLLDEAEKIAAQHGKKWLRLDAWRTNELLHAYYTRQGFQAVRTVSLEHRGSGALFQRSVQKSGRRI